MTRTRREIQRLCWGKAAFGGKIKKSEEIRNPTALTFSGGWVNNAHGTQATDLGVDPQSGTIKSRGCVYSGICLFSFLYQAESQWDFILFSATIPKDLCPLGRSLWKEDAGTKRQRKRVTAIEITRARRMAKERGRMKGRIGVAKGEKGKEGLKEKAKESRCNYFRSSSWTDFKIVQPLASGPRRKTEELEEGRRPKRRINLVKRESPWQRR